MPESKNRRKKKRRTTKKRAAPQPTLPDRRLMERHLRDIGTRPADEALHEAQTLIYDAMESPDPRTTARLARKALDISPLCADAYVLLAETEARTFGEQKTLYERGVEAGELALGPDGFDEHAGHFWGFLETRPYMRARAGLAQTLDVLGKHKEAAEHYQDMLKLNPNDNQGIRYELAACLLSLGDDAGLDALMAAYPDEPSAFMLYTRALLAYRRGGDSEEARKLANEAWQSNVHVPAILKARRRPNTPDTGYMTVGGKDEAVYYRDRFGFAWRGTPGAIDWLIGADSTGYAH